MKPLFILLPLMAAALTACHDPLLDNNPATQPTPSAPPDANASVSIGATSEPVAPVPPGMAAPVAQAPTEPANAFPGTFATEETLQTLNMYLLEYQSTGAQLPATIEEMIARKIIPKIPPPPAGKRFSVDTQRAMVTFADN